MSRLEVGRLIREHEVEDVLYYIIFFYSEGIMRSGEVVDLG